MKITVLVEDSDRPATLVDELLLWKTDTEGELSVVAGRSVPGGPQGTRWIWVPIARFAAGAWTAVRLDEPPENSWFERWTALQLKQEDWHTRDLL